LLLLPSEPGKRFPPLSLKSLEARLEL